MSIAEGLASQFALDTTAQRGHNRCWLARQFANPRATAHTSRPLTPGRRRRSGVPSTPLLSLRLKLSEDEVQSSPQAAVDLCSAYKQLGLSHVAIDFRRDELSYMLEGPDWVATELRPAIEAAQSVLSAAPEVAPRPTATGQTRRFLTRSAPRPER